MWGPGAPAFEGRVVKVAEALCYPRPLQEHVPILVGGSGERRTLRLVARYADACNFTGDVANVGHKLAVLREHCAAVGRDPATIEVTHLGSVTLGDAEPAGAGIGNVAGTVEDHVGRYRELAEAGVQTALVRMPALDERAIEAFAPVLASFSR